MYAFMRELIQESLRDWFKKEDWVRIDSAGNIAGPCGTSKNKKNPDRCLPRKKAQSLTKGERAATARKKKKAGSKGKTVVKNTKKATVTKEDLRNLVVGLIQEIQGNNTLSEKDDRCTRIAKSKYDTWPSAYASGAVVRCRRGEIWKKKLNESPQPTYTMYSGITGDAWEKIWKYKNFKDKVTNVTNDEDFALDYSYNFKTGKYEDKYVEISNIPLDAFVAVRDRDYEDDDDFESIEGLDDEKKINAIKYNDLFLVNLLPYKSQIKTTLKEESLNEMECKHGKYYCNHDKKYKCRKGPKKSR